MGWYDDYQKIDFDKRNILNDKIKYLEVISSQMSELAKIVYQDATAAKTANLNIINSKKISSYPSIRDILIDADFSALDSPWKFDMILKVAKESIESQIIALKIDRKEINEITKDKKRKWKGWV